jgi:hypothetical protein
MDAGGVDGTGDLPRRARVPVRESVEAIMSETPIPAPARTTLVTTHSRVHATILSAMAAESSLSRSRIEPTPSTVSPTT